MDVKGDDKTPTPSKLCKCRLVDFMVNTCLTKRKTFKLCSSLSSWTPWLTLVLSHTTCQLWMNSSPFRREVTSLTKTKLYLFISVNVETYLNWSLHQHQSNLVTNPKNINIHTHKVHKGFHILCQGVSRYNFFYSSGCMIGCMNHSYKITNFRSTIVQ
jgi:hypothetical protein